MAFSLGDAVTDILSQGKWYGVIVRLEGIRAVVRTTTTDPNTGGYSDIWYPLSWLTHVEKSDIPKRERPMEDTREYLQSVTGGT